MIHSLPGCIMRRTLSGASSGDTTIAWEQAAPLSGWQALPVEGCAHAAGHAHNAQGGPTDRPEGLWAIHILRQDQSANTKSVERKGLCLQPVRLWAVHVPRQRGPASHGPRARISAVRLHPGCTEWAARRLSKSWGSMGACFGWHFCLRQSPHLNVGCNVRHAIWHSENSRSLILKCSSATSLARRPLRFCCRQVSYA